MPLLGFTFPDIKLKKDDPKLQASLKKTAIESAKNEKSKADMLRNPFGLTLPPERQMSVKPTLTPIQEKQKMLADSQAANEAYKQKFRKNSGVELARAVVTSPVKVGIQTMPGLLPTLEKTGVVKTNDKGEWTPKSDIAKFFVGDEPVKSLPQILQGQAKSFEESKSTGDFVKNIGAGALVLGSMAADATPVGAGEKAGAKAVKQIFKNKAEKTAVEFFGEAGAGTVGKVDKAFVRKQVNEALAGLKNADVDIENGYATFKKMLSGNPELLNADAARITKATGNEQKLFSGTAGGGATNDEMLDSFKARYAQEKKLKAQLKNPELVYPPTETAAREVPVIPQEATPGTALTQGEKSPLPAPQSLPPDSSKTLQPSEILSYGNSKTPLAEAVKRPVVNMTHYAISDDASALAKRAIAENEADITKYSGERLSHAEVADIAKSDPTLVNPVITREATAQAEAANLLLRQRVAEAADSGKVTKEFIESLAQVKALAADAARRLESQKTKVTSASGNLLVDMIDTITKTGANVDEVIKAAEGVDFTNPTQAALFYRKFVKPNTTEILDMLRYNSMLSSPLTHIKNVTSNFVGSLIVAPLEKTLTGLIDATKHAVFGTERKYAVGEGAAYFKGYIKNLKKASGDFFDVMRGKVGVENPDLRNIQLFTTGPKATLEKIAKFPVRLLEAEDRFFQALVQRGSKESLLYRQGKGIETTNIDTKAVEEAMHRLFRGKSQPGDEGKVLNAIDAVGDTLIGLTKSKHPLVKWPAKLTLPFLQTPTKLLKQGIEYSPLGFTTIIGAKNKAEQLSKAIIGSSAAAGVAMLAADGRLSFAEPTNATEKQEFRAAGIQPYSVKLGDKWYSYKYLHPSLAFSAAFTAAVHEGWRAGKIDDSYATTILSSVAKYANFMVDQSYLKQVGDLVASAKGDVEGITKVGANYTQQFIPFRAMMSWISRIVDPTQHTADPSGSALDKQIQYFLMQIPWASKGVPARTDKNGQPIKNTNTLLNSISPVTVSNEDKGLSDAYFGKQKAKDEIKTFENKFEEKYGGDVSGTAEARKALAEIKTLGTKEEKAKRLREIAASNPDLIKKMVAANKQEALGLTPEEEAIKNMPVASGKRGAYLLEKVKALGTKEEKAAFLLNLVKKKLLTKSDLEALKKLKAEQGI